jgi:LPXTG-site transpeptidase (sortase) family protein
MLEKTFFAKFKIIDSKSAALALVVFLSVFSILYWRTGWNTQPVFEKSADTASTFAGGIDKNILQNTDWDNDGLENYIETLHGTNPNIADTDGDGYSDAQEIKNGYDPAAPGDARPAVELAIPKIGVVAPMVWSKSEQEKDQLADLAQGVAHFAKTASPGQSGNMIISGHSSNYIWAKGNFNYIFKNLNNLGPGDIVDVKTTQQNGKVVTYQYKITEKFTTVPNDARIFGETGAPVLTLSTCWPIGSNARRLILKGELI